MQAVLCSVPLSNHFLDAMDIDKEDKELFLESRLNYTFKLRGVFEEDLSLLKEIFSTRDMAIVFSKYSSEANGSFEALITGSRNQILKASVHLASLDSAGKNYGAILTRAIKDSSKQPAGELKLGKHTLSLQDNTLIMGILNVTPDSFSDGGQFERIEDALAQAYRMAEDGADIVDIGGESTRPGHQQITAEEELQRIMPVINALKKDTRFNLPLSVDTYKAYVAEQALEAGVEMLNDVWGFKENPEISKVAARYEVPVCLMHNRSSTDYSDFIMDMIAELEESVAIAHQAGIDDRQILIDPGIGFGKNYTHNLDAMRHLPDLCSLGYPLLLGTSRKSLIGKTLNLPAEERLEGTAATVAYGITAGAAIVRVHDVREIKRVALMTDAMVRR